MKILRVDILAQSILTLSILRDRSVGELPMRPEKLLDLC